MKTEIPGPKSRSLAERRRQAVPRGPFHVSPIYIESARGAILKDVDGNEFIDFASGIGVTNLGHSDPDVVGAIVEQAPRFLHSSFNVSPYESYIEVCEALNKLTPGNFAKKTFLANSGAEAVENAIKIARAYTKRQSLVCFEHAFHGRTYMAMTLTAKAKPYRYGFGPYLSDVLRVPYPYSYRWPTSSDPEVVSTECFRIFEETIQAQVGATQVAAVIIEPVLGEGGFIPAPMSFLKKLREFCSANEIVLIADEIQSGFGRTGNLYACEHSGLVPDLITSAKGLANGMPLSAVTGRAEIMDAPIEGGIGGTFGGNPVSCAAALSTIKKYQAGSVLENAKAMGSLLSNRLNAWKEMFSIVGDVRGLGLMQGMELVADRKLKTPHPEATKTLVQKACQRGLILMSAGSHSNVIRFLPPVTISRDLLSEGLDVVEKLLGEINV